MLWSLDGASLAIIIVVGAIAYWISRDAREHGMNRIPLITWLLFGVLVIISGSKSNPNLEALFWLIIACIPVYFIITTQRKAHQKSPAPSLCPSCGKYYEGIQNDCPLCGKTIPQKTPVA